MSFKKVRIGDVAEVKSSKRIFAGEYTLNGIPFFRSKEIGELSRGEEIQSELFISEKKYFEIKQKFGTPSKGDLLVTSVGSIGNTWIVDDRDFYYKDGNITQIVPSKNLSTKYLQYFIRSAFFIKSLDTNTSGSAYNALTIDKLKKIEVPLPSLSTQKKIAEILDTADALRQHDKALIEKYNQLTQSLFLEMFGKLKGELKQLSEVCIINPRKAEIDHVEKGTLVSFIPMANVSETGHVLLTEVRNLQDVWTGFTYFANKDVTFAKITPCMENGKGAIMENLINGIGFGSTEFHVLRPISGISTSEWIFYLTKMPFFRREAEKNMTGSAGQKRVPADFLSNYRVVIPEVQLQNKFKDCIQQIEKQKQLAEESLQKSEALFNALLQKAFNGELVKDETDTKSSTKQSLTV